MNRLEIFCVKATAVLLTAALEELCINHDQCQGCIQFCNSLRFPLTSKPSIFTQFALQVQNPRDPENFVLMILKKTCLFVYPSLRVTTIFLLLN